MQFDLEMFLGIADRTRRRARVRVPVQGADGRQPGGPRGAPAALRQARTTGPPSPASSAATRVGAYDRFITVSRQWDERIFRAIETNDNQGTLVQVDLRVTFRIVDSELALFAVNDWEEALESTTVHEAAAELAGKDRALFLSSAPVAVHRADQVGQGDDGGVRHRDPRGADDERRVPARGHAPDVRGGRPRSSRSRRPSARSAGGPTRRCCSRGPSSRSPSSRRVPRPRASRRSGARTRCSGAGPRCSRRTPTSTGCPSSIRRRSSRSTASRAARCRPPRSSRPTSSCDSKESGQARAAPSPRAASSNGHSV